MTDRQKEILKKIRALPLRKYGSVKHKRLIQEYRCIIGIRKELKN